MMATKTISLSEEAYHRLKRMKRQGESFTDVVLRLTGREDLMKYAGSISDEFAEELSGNIRRFRARFDEEFRRRVGSWTDQEEAADEEGDT